VTLVPRRGEERRARRGALGLKRKEVQMSWLRLIPYVLHDDAEEILRAGVDVVDELHGILRAALDIRAVGHHPAGALLDQIEIVVIARGAEAVIPRQEDGNLAIRGQLDNVVGLGAEAQDVGRIVVMPETVVPSIREST
jgi:hypothetical protein